MSASGVMTRGRIGTPPLVMTRGRYGALVDARVLSYTRLDYQMDAGTTLVIPFAATYVDDGLPANLTTASITCLVKGHYAEPDSMAIATFTTLSGGIIPVDLQQGIGHVIVPATVTANVRTAAWLVYTIRVYLSGGQVYDIASGSIIALAQAVLAITHA